MARDLDEERRRRWAHEEDAREGRAIVNAWAQAQGPYLDIDHYASEQGIHWLEAYRRCRETTQPGKGAR